MVRLLVVVCVLVVVGCSVGAEVGDSAFGVWVDNECARPIHAEAAHTAEIAIERLSSGAIEVPSGQGREISVIENAAAHPTAYFLAISVDDGEPLVREFDIVRLKSELVRTTFAADCVSLVEQNTPTTTRP